MTTDSQKKKTTRLALATLYISFSAFGAGLLYLWGYQENMDSLHTNAIAGYFMTIGGTAWFFLSIITFFAF